MFYILYGKTQFSLSYHFEKQFLFKECGFRERDSKKHSNLIDVSACNVSQIVFFQLRTILPALP